MSIKYNIEDVAKILNTTQKAVRRIVASGEIKSSKIGSRYIITQQALEEYQNYLKTAVSTQILEENV